MKRPCVLALLLACGGTQTTTETPEVADGPMRCSAVVEFPQGARLLTGFGADEAAARRRLDDVIQDADETAALLAQIVWRDDASWPPLVYSARGDIDCQPLEAGPDEDPNAREWSRLRGCSTRLSVDLAAFFANLAQHGTDEVSPELLVHDYQECLAAETQVEGYRLGDEAGRHACVLDDPWRLGNRNVVGYGESLAEASVDAVYAMARDARAHVAEVRGASLSIDPAERSARNAEAVTRYAELLLLFAVESQPWTRCRSDRFSKLAWAPVEGCAEPELDAATLRGPTPDEGCADYAAGVRHQLRPLIEQGEPDAQERLRMSLHSEVTRCEAACRAAVVPEDAETEGGRMTRPASQSFDENCSREVATRNFRSERSFLVLTACVDGPGAEPFEVARDALAAGHDPYERVLAFLDGGSEASPVDGAGAQPK